MQLGPGEEFDRIREIARVLGERAEGLGDDCAVLESRPESLCVSTDAMVEQVHFRLDWLSLEEVGWRAVAAALSDLAAEGASPAGVLTSVRRDRNGDNQPDEWLQYKQQVLIAILYDDDYDGRVDRREEIPGATPKIEMPTTQDPIATGNLSPDKTPAKPAPKKK